MRVLLRWSLFILAIVWLVPLARAQTPAANLLVNGDLETPYYAQGAPTRTVPQGWGLWVGEGLPDALPHKDSPQVYSGAVAWHLRQNGGGFTAAGYQQVSGLTPGTVLELAAHAWAFACDDVATRCAIATFPYASSDTRAGMIVRVGIDPTGGLDPLSQAVQWSDGESPYDRWASLRVTATAQSDTVTVYLYMTQQTGLALNSIYWDAVTLTAESPAQQDVSPVPTASPTVAPSPTPTPTLTPTPVATVPAALSASTGRLCAAIFEDGNANGIRDDGEPALAGLRLLVTGAERADTFTSSEQDDPLCIELSPGTYEVAVLPQEGVGLTDGQAMLVTVWPGRQANVAFGAATGYVPPTVPPVTETLVAPADANAALAAPSLNGEVMGEPQGVPLQDQLYDYSGLLVLALAVAVGGGSALVLLALRRPV
ncbi:MAG: hypothetical protein Kow00106_17540 [Anaerolineae bacterium]